MNIAAMSNKQLTVMAETHEHKAGEFSLRDEVIAHLTKHGFKADPGNKGVNAADHRPKFFSKMNKHTSPSSGEGHILGRSQHTVAVYPDGSWEHAHEVFATTQNTGLSKLKHLDFDASSADRGMGVRSLRLLLAKKENISNLADKPIKRGKPGNEDDDPFDIDDEEAAGAPAQSKKKVIEKIKPTKLIKEKGTPVKAAKKKKVKANNPYGQLGDPEIV